MKLTLSLYAAGLLFMVPVAAEAQARIGLPIEANQKSAEATVGFTRVGARVDDHFAGPLAVDRR